MSDIDIVLAEERESGARAGASDVERVVRTFTGEGTNPRWLLWTVWHGDNPSMMTHDFIIWINARWKDWSEATGQSLNGKSKETHKEFDRWLLQWVRSEIVRTVSVSDGF